LADEVCRMIALRGWTCLALALGTPAWAAPLGPDAQYCRSGSGPALLVNVHGFRRQAGTIRVQLHGSNASTWLERGGWARRIELPVTAPTMPVCIRLPSPGRYAVAVRHDEDGDGRMTRRDGGGYSRNPRLSIASLRPAYDAAAFSAGPGQTRIDIVMQYLTGVSVRPVGSSQ
jgi:uncharacterized protein (DUF2141 family)